MYIVYGVVYANRSGLLYPGLKMIMWCKSKSHYTSLGALQPPLTGNCSGATAELVALCSHSSHIATSDMIFKGTGAKNCGL